LKTFSTEKEGPALFKIVNLLFRSQEQKRVPHKRGDFLKAIGLSGQGKEIQDEVLRLVLVLINIILLMLFWTQSYD
jgi:hypothetical protein